jgi:hypothetical protein
MSRPPNRSGGPRKGTAAVEHRAKTETPDCHSEAVKPEQMAAWIDEAILTLRRAAKDPVEFQRLGLWLNSMRRALP